MSSTRLILVRHGETESNVEGRYQGQLDSGLTVTGRAQAQALAARVARHRIAAIYTSDLVRARDTARKVADATGLNVILDARLRERHLGLFQGLLKTEIRAKFPDEYRRYKSDPDHVISGGESACQSSARMISCLEEIATRHAGQQLVVVAHGGAVSSLLRHTLGIPLGARRRFKCPNAAWNIFIYDDDKWFLETWGDMSHLESQPPR